MYREIWFAAALGMAFALSASAAGAEQDRIEIDYAACADQVGLTAADAMLSDVLRALATELQFELHFKSDNDRAISVALRKPARELIETLGRDDNIMITNEADARCDEPIDRLRAVWFLGTGPEVAYQPATVAPAYKLPETGEAQARTTGQSGLEGNDVDKDGERRTKRKRDMSPEERYNEKLRRKAEKGKY